MSSSPACCGEAHLCYLPRRIQGPSLAISEISISLHFPSQKHCADDFITIRWTFPIQRIVVAFLLTFNVMDFQAGHFL